MSPGTGPSPLRVLWHNFQRERGIPCRWTWDAAAATVLEKEGALPEPCKVKSWCVHNVHRPKFKQTKKTKQLNLKVGKRQTLHPRALEGVKAAQQKGFRSICRWRNAQAARMRQCRTVTRPSEMKTPRAPHSGRTQSGGRFPTRLKADSLCRSQPHSSGRTPENGNLYSHKP